MRMAALADVERLAPILQREHTGDRHGEAALGRGIAHLVAQRRKIGAQRFQRPHHAIDLGPPRIGDDEDFQMRGHTGDWPRQKSPRSTRE